MIYRLSSPRLSRSAAKSCRPLPRSRWPSIGAFARSLPHLASPLEQRAPNIQPGRAQRLFDPIRSFSSTVTQPRPQDTISHFKLDDEALTVGFEEGDSTTLFVGNTLLPSSLTSASAPVPQPDPTPSHLHASHAIWFIRTHIDVCPERTSY